jgi:hypothetical protein
MNKTWYKYKLLNLLPEVPEGHTFNSTIDDLEKHPELCGRKNVPIIYQIKLYNGL